MAVEHKNKLDIWNPSFHEQFLGYASIAPFWQNIAASFLNWWPTPLDFNVLAKDLPFQFISQEKTTRYELEAYAFNRIPMRQCSWHDFFNNLTWLIWPTLKRAIVERTVGENSGNLKQRTPRQNLLTHFDECGIIICSHSEKLFRHIEQFHWKQFFWETRDLPKICEIIIIGHGLLEKALSPYIGMTGKALFLKVEADFFTRSYEAKMDYIDQTMATRILSQDFPHSPQTLYPFPLLGWPKWWPNNECETFYENVDYFRRKRELS